MKTMRYRIRVITLVLVVSLAAVLLWNIRAVWFPSVPLPLSAEESPALPSVSVSPDPSPAPEQTPAEESPSPEPLYDTSGL